MDTAGDPVPVRPRAAEAAVDARPAARSTPRSPGRPRRRRAASGWSACASAEDRRRDRPRPRPGRRRRRSASSRRSLGARPSRVGPRRGRSIDRAPIGRLPARTVGRPMTGRRPAIAASASTGRTPAYFRTPARASSPPGPRRSSPPAPSSGSLARARRLAFGRPLATDEELERAAVEGQGAGRRSPATTCRRSPMRPS